MEVRPRRDADLDACVRLARVVQRLDGYPPHLPADLPRFVLTPDAWAAWVVEADPGGEIAGHIVLTRTSSEPVMTMASRATGTPLDRLGVVARLFVAPSRRRNGIGRSLLAAATREALGRSLCPVLDVGTHFLGAIGLYEAAGWQRLGEVQVDFGDQILHEFVYCYRP